MKPTLFLCFLIFASTCLKNFGQVNDNFSDGNFNTNPTWTGDDTKFTVALGELWLNAPVVTDVAFLSTPSAVLSNASWECYNRMAFNPSSSNFARFYITSDQRNLNASNINGYFVELGRLNDEISLYKQVNGISTKIIDGPDNMLNAAGCTTRVKVTRTGNLWELLVDSLGGTSFTSLGTYMDVGVNETYFMGAYCKYTSTRSDKFFFDDVVASGTNWVDAIPPNILSYQASGNLLTLQLNEPVLNTDLTAFNFTLDNGLSVVNVVEDSLDCRKLKISASGNFTFNTLYHLNIGNLHDFNGNVSSSIVHPFLLHVAVPGEIVLTEFMADPSPPLGLPNTEYIEIFNNSAYPINLNLWSLKVGTIVKSLPSLSINANDYVLLVDINDTGLFNPSIKKIGIVSFPNITNGGTNIELYDSTGAQMDAINFDLNWYKDPLKSGGGYSIERINPNDLCMKFNNWMATNEPAGGTPGLVNSIDDTTTLAISANYFLMDSVHILLTFNQWMDTSTFVIGNFNLANLIGIQIISADSCILALSSPLVVNIPQVLTLNTLLADCSNHSLLAPMDVYVVNYVPQIFDVLVHELMVDESPPILLPAAEYIEIYNSKTFPINLAGWNLVVNNTIYTLGNLIVPADSFIILVDETNLSLFAGLNAGSITGFNGMSNSDGIIELYHSNGMLIHAAKYNVGYYDVAGKDNGGWSLEMIDHSKPCLRNTNWTASQDPFGGTPGRRNSLNISINDLIKPHAIKTGLRGTDTLVVYFDESILPNSFTLSNIVFPVSVSATSFNWNTALLDEYWVHLQNPILADSIYYIRLHGLNDCEGNIIVTDSLPFSIPVIPNNFDLIINEVLADPVTNCIDFIEIYNRGTKSVDLSQLIIGEGDTTTHLLTNYIFIHPVNVLLHSGEYLYISENHETVMSCYGMIDSTSYWDVVNLPDFANASGTVGISTHNQQWIDMFAYNDEMHFSLLGSTDGVSLERMDLNAATQNKMNWHSAASTVGYGTPGYQNSEFSASILISDDFTIDPEVFSPDNDGYKDFVTIYYQLANAGYAASLKIYDQVGRLQKTLVNNETLGTSGSFVWDGTTDTGGKANVGIHIIFFELINPNGEILHFKKPVVVGTKL